MSATPLNQRPVKVVDGMFSIETAAEQRRDDRLCFHCGIGFEACKIQSQVATRNLQLGIEAPVKRCGDFRPVLGFRPPFLGLESRFNTFRLGAGWGNRLIEGRLVVLADGRNGDHLGVARVESFEVGPLRDMLRRHATTNHMMLEESDDHVRKLAGVLRSHYGPHLLSPDKPATVIFLERTDV